MIEEKTGIPVVGTVPYIKIQLDDEDSLSENLHTRAAYRDKKDEIQLAIVRLPHISNFTDFIPLQNHAGVNVYYAEEPNALGNPDCIIIPGTKNTLDDLQWLKETGFAERIQSEAKGGTLIVGICGGFQILGIRNQESVSGLGLLPVETVFSEEKTLTRVEGSVTVNGRLATDDAGLLQNLHVAGYEIHQGQTQFVPGAKEAYFAKITDSVTGETKMDGAVQGSVFGTYIHGLFDEAEFTEVFLEMLAQKKGFDIKLVAGESQILNEYTQSSKKVRSVSEFRQGQYDLLADTLRKYIDMAKIYEIMRKN